MCMRIPFYECVLEYIVVHLFMYVCVYIYIYVYNCVVAYMCKCVRVLVFV